MHKTSLLLLFNGCFVLGHVIYFVLYLFKFNNDYNGFILDLLFCLFFFLIPIILPLVRGIYFCYLTIIKSELDQVVVVDASNPCIQEAKAGGIL